MRLQSHKTAVTRISLFFAMVLPTMPIMPEVRKQMFFTPALKMEMGRHISVENINVGNQDTGLGIN